MSTTTAPTLPSTQKALIFNTQTNALSLTSTAPVPSPSADEHIIKVHSTAITNGELTWAPFVNWPTHHTPCYDVSGTILTPLPNSPFSPGDAIYGRIEASREGTARQYATIQPSEAARVPTGLGMRDAAVVPMSALTAWQALFEHGLLTGKYTPDAVPHVDAAGKVVGGQASGKRVLVLGAAGGVGMMAVQFARLAGAWTAGTASGRNEAFLKGLSMGPDEVVDYTQISMREWVAGHGGEEGKFDLVFDCVGGKAMRDGWSAVRAEGGVYVSVVPGFGGPEGGKPPGVRTAWFVMESRGSELREIGKFIERGLVRGSVDSVWRIEEFEEAFKKTASGHARGKVVLEIAEGEEE
ncbi:NAD(P)-binding protein [Trematosphaeria pertusa]|uniref:NAD(P)-binding protein n=1 Tax=Trematosphaeria pertusa TaxID=390896 RepID=A0A6A6IP82_9PLEO|nr:NAD(P)-binding protein [Trematosphaeria pertusa]KAF2252335.1 NAD(P)-binding protein [Trematosphaeria pertusa]